MNSYQISDLERLTGVAAHTIRIWEKRYNLIQPHRTRTNIRYYDDEQAKKLLKVSTLLQHGMKISHIAALSDKQLNEHIADLEKGAPNDAICAGFINDLIASMLTFDEVGFEKVFSSAVIRLGMYEAMVRVLYPFLKKTGLMWSSSEAMPVQEHFASAIIRRKLIAAIDGLPMPHRKSKTFLLFLPPEEWHETGLLLADYMIRAKGYKTIYLGQNVPMDNLQKVIANTRPTHLLALYITRQADEKMQNEMHDLAISNKACQLLVCGSGNVLQSVRKAKNIAFLSSPSELAGIL